LNTRTLGRKMPTETANVGKKSGYKDKEKPTQIRFSNITAAKGWADFLFCSIRNVGFIIYRVKYVMLCTLTS